MCGRFTQYSTISNLSALFNADCRLNFSASYNLAPTQDALTVIKSEASDQNEIVSMRWGLVPSWAKDEKIGNKTINARSETVHEKPSFRSAYKKRRCIIPADGFYEWHKRNSAKQPVYIRRKDQAPLAFAGLWEEWHDLRTFTILTKEADDVIKPIHHRMPIMFTPENYAQWLSFKDVNELKTLDTKILEYYEVDPLVNSPKNNNPDLVSPMLKLL